MQKLLPASTIKVRPPWSPTTKQGRPIEGVVQKSPGTAKNPNNAGLDLFVNSPAVLSTNPGGLMSHHR